MTGRLGREQFGKMRFYNKLKFDTLEEETIAIRIKRDPYNGPFSRTKTAGEE